MLPASTTLEQTEYILMSLNSPEQPEDFKCTKYRYKYVAS